MLADLHGRRFGYLRLSVTEACNFKCVYCLPEGYRRTSGPEPLSVAEIGRLARGFAGLGMFKVRVTGGEPTLRRDLPEILATLQRTPGVRRLALSTNGHRLREQARDFRLLGVHGLNVSVDSLDPAKFAAVTGRDALGDVMAGVEDALGLGFDSVKLNAVLLKGVNDTPQDWELFAKHVHKRPLTWRFIELMPTVRGIAAFDERHVSATSLLSWLLERGWTERPREEGDGPAREFTHPEFVGRIGVIAPYSKDFCQSCNRLRVSAQGHLQLCLFGEGRHGLRAFLQDDSQLEELQHEVQRVLRFKTPSHELHQGSYGNNATFSAIGG